jgi:quinol monooxygenase YgiN
VKTQAAAQVTAVVEMIAKRGKEDEGRELLKTLVEPSRKGDGCLRYEVLELLDRPGHFVVLSDWMSKAAVDAHPQSSHMTAILPKIPLVYEDPLRILYCSRIN